MLDRKLGRLTLIIFLCSLTNVYGAELLLQVGNSNGFKDGDIVHAVNDRAISDVHLQHLCHVKNEKLKKDGLRNSGTCLEEYLKVTSLYKFERISYSEVRRTNLDTLDTDVIGHEPNAQGEHMIVERHIQYMLKDPRHKVFGTENAEYWYGGNRPRTVASLNKVWKKVEDTTAHKQADYTEFPWKDRELKRYLAISVDDFPDEVITLATTPEKDKDDTVIKNRIYYIDYKNDLGLNSFVKASIADKDTKVDIRYLLMSDVVNVVQTRPSLSVTP